MRDIWHVHDRKGSDPTAFTSEGAAVAFAEQWVNGMGLLYETASEAPKRTDYPRLRY